MDEKLISDISYTNKDFQSIYPELLDLVKKLTNKWDPSLSNESDPGVLLLKLNALIADKNNYNIDKNILECFPSSVTQYGNARKIYDSLGYKMGWYKSATTQVGFQLKNTTGLTESEPVLIDLFTQLTDDTKEVSYVTLQGALLSLKQSNNVVKVDVIEGTVQNYEVNGSTEITLSNLDDNLRLYFNESRIAENGIYIKSNIDADWFSWKKVDNIITYPLESKVFEFGVLPNSDTCYIQFPTDINTLVSSFEIKFIISNGVNGNIKSNILNQFVNNIPYGEGDSAIVVNDKIKITQQSGTTNGADIETLDQAYSNYKKTIGTFNTLVTAKDYESAIYNLKDDDKYLISNVIVSDRSNDINTSVRVAEWTLKNQSNVLYTLKTDSNSSSPRFGVSDICLYLLKSSSNLNNANDYNATFSMNLGDEYIASIRGSIIEQLEDIKSLQHNYIYPENLSDELVLKHIYGIFLNLYKLDGQFITYQKVTREEKIEIESNIKIALYKNYNARNLNFGNDIDYYDLIDVIKGADARIKDVILNIPEISTYSNHTKADTSGIYEIRPLSYDEKIDLIAKMVLSGNVQLFNFDSFDYDFGQRNVKRLDGTNAGVTDSSIKSISTNFNFSLEPSGSIEVVGDDATVLQENQSVQFCTPNYVTVKTFSSWVKYTYNGVSSIPKDTMYKLGVGEYITITYTDAAGVQQSDKIENSYIQSNVELKPNEPTMLLAGQQIDVKALNKQELIVGTKYYFITKSKSLTIGPNSSYMLQEGEYFIYTNQVNDEFVLLGSGTLIENNSVSETFGKVIDDSDASMLDDISSISWIQLDVPLTLVEMQVTTLGAGVQLKSDKVVSTTSSGVTLPTNADDSITIRAWNGSGNVIATFNINADTPYTIYSKLNLNSTQESPQRLHPNEEITFKFVNDAEYELKYVSYEQSDKQRLVFDYPVVLSGGTDLDMSVLTDNGYEYVLNAYVYDESSILDKEGKQPSRRDGFIMLTGSDYLQSGVADLSFTFDSTDSASTWLLPIAVANEKVESGNKFELSVSVSNDDGTETIKFYDYSNPSVKSFTSYDDNMLRGYVVALDMPEGYKSDGKLTVKLFGGATASASDIIYVGRLYKVNGFNESLNVSGNFSLDDVIGESLVKDLLIYRVRFYLNEDYFTRAVSSGVDKGSFNWVMTVKAGDLVAQPTLPQSFFNTNHVANRYTMSKIDFDNYNISLNPYYLV